MKRVVDRQTSIARPKHLWKQQELLTWLPSTKQAVLILILRESACVLDLHQVHIDIGPLSSKHHPLR